MSVWLKAFKEDEQMNRQDAEKIITEFLRPIFGFALKRCRDDRDAEDLTGEIVLRAYRALLLRDDIENPSGFVWTVAHNVLVNYYRDRNKSAIGVSIDEIAETLADPSDPFDDGEDAETIRRLQGEIAYLSKTRREIVIAYWFRNKPQAEIAENLGIPLGTVKWHLFEAKKELKRGMNKMRESGELKFNPVEFGKIWVSGSPGTHTPQEILRSTLTQNICYDVRRKAKTVEEIADDLGVSPVFIEGEAEYLEEYGFLKKQGRKFIANFIITDETAEYLSIEHETYKKAAAVFAPALFDKLTDSGILDDPDIVCHQSDDSDDPIDLKTEARADGNFILWSLIPFVTALSGEDSDLKPVFTPDDRDEEIKFEEVAVIRPDGGNNIVSTSVRPSDFVLPNEYAAKNWSGPMWNTYESTAMWRFESEWAERLSVEARDIPQNGSKVVRLYLRDGELSYDEYAWLAEKGFIRVEGDPGGEFRVSWQPVILPNEEIKKKLIGVGNAIREEHRDELRALKDRFVEASLSAVPPHLKKTQEYLHQYLFTSDGQFVFYCLKNLVGSGKLKLPTENQRKILSTVIFSF